MADTAYTYSLATDFAGGINTDNLVSEIRLSAITVALADVQINPAGDNPDRLDIVFKVELPTADKTVLDGDASPAAGLIAAHNPVAKPVIQPVELRSLVPVGDEGLVVTHDFGDPTTWFMDSQRVTDEETIGSYNDGDRSVTVEAGGGGHPAAMRVIIDLHHGKLHDEERYHYHAQWEPTNPQHSYEVAVAVDGVPLTRRPAFATDWSQGGDFYVDYVSRQIIFQNSQLGASSILASYSYPLSSRFSLKPPPGTQFIVQRAEVQFSESIDFCDTVVYRTGIEVAPGVFVDVLRPRYYKTFGQIVQEAFGTFPEIPVLGGTRGFSEKWYNFPFLYSANQPMPSSVGLEMRISLANDVPFGGSASITFHLKIESEE